MGCILAQGGEGGEERGKQAAPEMLELLKKLASIKEPIPYPTYCPFCDKEGDGEHEDDCKLGNILKKVES